MKNITLNQVFFLFTCLTMRYNALHAMEQYAISNYQKTMPSSYSLHNVNNKKLTRNDNLIQLTNTSTEKKFHFCSKCPKKFALKGSLRKHTKTHVVKNPYSCITCNRKFNNKLDYTTHTNLHLSLEERIKKAVLKDSTLSPQIQRINYMPIVSLPLEHLPFEAAIQENLFTTYTPTLEWI